MGYQVVKTYGHDLGLSATFRQYKADSHCNKLHGYALQVTLVFESNDLNDANWVIGFGDLKPIKEFLEKTFDHKLVVAEDDPMLEWVLDGQTKGYCDVVVLPKVGCEAFAEYVGNFVNNWLMHKIIRDNLTNRPQLISVEIREHGSNAAKWINTNVYR